ncbi:FlgO family outer membrane protein [soil metagenome]
MKSLLLILFPALLLSGCAELWPQRPSTTAQPTFEEAATNEFIPTNYKAADALIAHARARGLDQDKPLIIATLVNINALDESSGFGRMVSEQISAQFSRSGYSMVEMKIRDNVYVKQSVGELLLTREIRDLASTHRAQAVIVGTYAESDRFVFVNLKVIRPADNIVIASHDYAVPVNKMVRSLFGRR